VAEVLEAGMAVALWLRYWAHEWLWFEQLNSLTKSSDERMHRNDSELSTFSQGILPVSPETKGLLQVLVLQ
jgi:hypothetical protein